MTEDKALLPCPFCGEKDPLIEAWQVDDDMLPVEDQTPISWGITCNCGLAFGCHETRDLVAAAWNRRAGQAEAEARVKALEVENARLREALRFYADRRCWHWNGRAWEWNGDGSAFYTGTKAKPSDYPDKDDVDRECGSIARTALESHPHD